ncbi:MAG: hypothetical protein NPIRA04_32550 [Nitrospirales bacterium]|nr:MAG: hypothetical protein NPIRA04_32550 [Nitrospirales bacterium]
MYGQPEIPRSALLKKADADFIKQVTDELGSRENASIAWAMRAEQYMKSGNMDYAMRRYNQSWLLNPNNYLSYWGFGGVLLRQGKRDEAIKHLEKAKQLIDDEYQEVALLSDTGSAYSVKADSIPKKNTQERARYFDLATQNFQQSTKQDPNYPNVWFFWARSLYFQEKYKESWEKVKKGQSLGANIPSRFLEVLHENFPEPK